MGGYGDVQLLREDGLRLDGRKVDEMREVKVEAGILPAADGSAWVQHGFLSEGISPRELRFPVLQQLLC